MKFLLFAIVTVVVTISAILVKPGEARISNEEKSKNSDPDERVGPFSPMELNKRRQMLRDDFLTKMFDGEKFSPRPSRRRHSRRDRYSNFQQQQGAESQRFMHGPSFIEINRSPFQRMPPFPPKRFRGPMNQLPPSPYPPGTLLMEEVIIIRRIPVVLAKILGIKIQPTGKFPQLPGKFPFPQAPGSLRPGNRDRPQPDEIEEIYPADQPTKGGPPPVAASTGKGPYDVPAVKLPPNGNDEKNSGSDVDLEKWDDEDQINPAAAFKADKKNDDEDESKSKTSEVEAESETETEGKTLKMEPVARASQGPNSDKLKNEVDDKTEQNNPEMEVENNEKKEFKENDDDDENKI